MKHLQETKGILMHFAPKHLGFSCTCSMKRIPLGRSPQGAGRMFDSMDLWQPATASPTGHPGKAQRRRSSTTPGAPVTARSKWGSFATMVQKNGAQDQGKLIMINYAS